MNKHTGQRTSVHTINTRAVVLELLLSEESGREFANRLLQGTLDKYDYLPGQDKSFIKRLFEGCVERKLQLDFIIDCYSKTKTRKMKPVIRQLLRMGAYQILYMDAVPDAAACNETVSLAGKKGFSGLKGFVNGVLRTVSREKNKIPWPDMQKSQIQYLAVRYSIPEWLTEHFLKDYGAETTERIFGAFLEEQPVTVRMDERLSDEEQERILEAVRNSGVQAEPHPYLSYAYRLRNVSGLSRLPGFAEGVFQVQDVSSMFVSEIAGLSPGMTVLDVCAAPGGKSLHAACKLNGTGLVSARDLTEAKTAMIAENAARGDYPNLEILVRDARMICEEDIERADVVYVDAPCSGLGIMGKKCDIRYRISPEQMQELCLLQREILDTVCRYVKPGGVLIYSTCTLNRAENEEQAAYIGKKGFQAESIDAFLPQELRSPQTADGYLKLLPGIHQSDGFFMARFRRI